MRAGSPAQRVAAVAALALFVGSAHADARPSPPMIGVNKAEEHGTIGLRGAAAMGARYDRVPIMQTDPFPVPSAQPYPWQALDDIFRDESAAGVRVLPLLLPKYQGFSASQTSAFVQWADWFMRRYGAGGGFWTEYPDLKRALAPTVFEVYNEVYGPWSEPSAPYDAAGYDDLFKQVATAGRGINPGFRFLFSATDFAQTADGQPVGKWADMVVNADSTIGGYIDGLAVHPYYFKTETNATGYDSTGYDRVTRQTKQFFADKGIDKPVYITEVGLCTSPQPLIADNWLPCGTVANQTAAIDYWFADFRNTPWIYALLVYQYQDCVPDQPCPSATSLYVSNKEAWFGLVDRWGVPKPGYAEFKNQARQTTS